MTTKVEGVVGQPVSFPLPPMKNRPEWLEAVGDWVRVTCWPQNFFWWIAMRYSPAEFLAAYPTPGAERRKTLQRFKRIGWKTAGVADLGLEMMGGGMAKNLDTGDGA